MLFKKTKDEALKIHERAREKYNKTVESLNSSCEKLYQCREKSQTLISQVQDLVNSIANTPKEFDSTFEKIATNIQTFNDTKVYATETLETARKAGANLVAGVSTGTAVAGLAPTAMMWVATTFGTASTGTAISSLSGAVATKAALAWLGGGALSAGGAGVAGGQALLALAGPIGWGIAGASVAVSASAVGIKNKKVADKVVEEAYKITEAGAVLNETIAYVDNIREETELLMEKTAELYVKCSAYENMDYLSLSDETQMGLGLLVNNTLSLSALLNKTVGDSNG